MKPHYLRLVALAAVTLGMASLFQNCSNASFTADASLDSVNSSLNSNGGPGDGSVPVICDPFDKKNIIDPQAGVEGRIYYTGDRLDQANCNNSDCSSRDYINNGTMVNAALFMNQVYVPTRNFTEGFDDNGANAVTDANNDVLVEWFALDLASNFILQDSDAEGMYQFAVISDDGATLAVNGQDILVHEGEHSPSLACASQVTPMLKGQMVPFNLSYFQGPRTQISLVLLWRKVAAGQNLADCGSSDGYLSSADNLPNSLSSKGWKVVKPGNFKLSKGSNLCAKTN